MINHCNETATVWESLQHKFTIHFFRMTSYYSIISMQILSGDKVG